MVKLGNVDITSYVDPTSIVTNDTLDESLASGAFVLPFVSSTDITNGDKPIPRFSEIDIDGLLYLVAEDSVKLVRFGTNKLYRHEVTLIEPTKMLQKRVIPNLTITQPQGDIANYIYSVNQVDSSQFTSGGFEVDNTLTTLPLTQTSTSQDTAVIDNRTLKNTNEYAIRLNYLIENRQEASSPTSQLPKSEDLDIVIEVYYGSTKIDDKQFRILGRPFDLLDTNKPMVHVGGFVINYTPTSANQAVSIKVKTLSNYDLNDDLAYITSFSLNISQPSGTDTKFYLDYVVDKLLSFHTDLSLSEEARTKLSAIVSPEFTFQGYTLYDALREVANYATGIVYLGESDFTTIHFYFYDEEIESTLPEVSEEEQIEYLDGFADGLEINASNVIRDEEERNAVIEPATNGFISVRSESDERGVQIIDSNTALKLQQPIYRPIKVEVKGLAFTMKDSNNNDVNFLSGEVWDITDYVVDSQVYNTFSSQSDLVNRGGFKNKSNTVYYTQGSNTINGLGFVGTLPPAWNQQQNPNYAIHEAILNKAAETYSGTYSFVTNYLVNVTTHPIHNLQFRIKHIPYSDVRLTVYKDGQTGNNIKYFNEQAPLNDMELLGKIAQENANRTGNKVIKYQGLTTENQFLLGSKVGDKVLVNYTISRTPRLNKYSAEYAIGYANISDYVGIDSKYRQFEVPLDTIVNRTDKKTQFFKLKTSDTVPTVTTPSYLSINNTELYSSLFGNYQSTPAGTRPTYAKITLDSSTVVESNIDAYRMGKTLGLAVSMLDNYSAGIKKEDREVYDGTQNIDVKVQEDVRYTDLFGNFTQAQIQYYPNVPATTQTVASSDAYPGNNQTMALTNRILDYTYTVNKDARERWGFVWEAVFQSGTGVILFDGFIKYNKLATETAPNAIEIRFLESGYIPNKKLDIDRTVKGTGTSSVPANQKYLQISATAPSSGSYEGLIVTMNREPIFAILTDDYDTGLQVTKYIYLEE